MNLIIRFLRDETAATAIEYALIACGIAVVIVSVVRALGTTVQGQYTAIHNAVESSK